MYKLFKKNQSRSLHAKSGFTLVEIIVSLAIFSIVAVVALGSLMKIISANRKAQSIQSAITNINFALDSMSRELRVGSKYYCNSNPTYPLTYFACDAENNNGVVTLYFQSSKTSGSGSSFCSLTYAYRFEPNSELDVDNNTTYMVSKAQQSECGGSMDFTPLISDNVNITGYKLHVSSQDEDSHPYPMILLGLSGYSGIRQQDRTYFNIQTAVSSRTP